MNISAVGDQPEHTTHTFNINLSKPKIRRFGTLRRSMFWFMGLGSGCETLPLIVFNKDPSTSPSVIVCRVCIVKTGDGTVTHPLSLQLSALHHVLKPSDVGAASSQQRKKRKTSFLADAWPNNHHFLTAASLHNHREKVKMSTIDIFQNDYSFIPWAAVFFSPAMLSRFAQT